MDITHLDTGSRLRSPRGRTYRITAPAGTHPAAWWATPDDGGRRTRITQAHLTGPRPWTVLDDYRHPEPGRDNIPAELAAALARAVPAGIEWDAKVSTRARRVGLVLDEHTRLQITVPARMAPADAAAAITASASQIRTAIHKRHPGGPPRPTGPTGKTMTGGEGFAWLGRSARLRTTTAPDAPPAARVRDGAGWWVQVRADLDPAQRAAEIIALYKTEGADLARDRAAGHLPRLGITTPPRIEVTDRPLPRHRWCQHYPRTNTIRLWWPLFQLDLTLVDFVIALALWDSRRGDPYRVPLSTFTGRDTAAVFADLARQGREVWTGTHRPA